MISALDLFRIGIGPSSSHTVGPMRAAAAFSQRLTGIAPDEVEVHLYGSLAATGAGHGTVDAVIAGLAGADPETDEPAGLRILVAQARATGEQTLPGGHRVPFRPPVMHPLTVLSEHPNGMRFVARRHGETVADENWFSVGGGFVVRQGDAAAQDAVAPPYPFSSADELLMHCVAEGVPIHEIVRRNELSCRSAAELDAGLDAVATAMDTCIDHGLEAEGVLPGGLGVRRRAAGWARQLRADDGGAVVADALEWLNVFALAVNEENASGERVVTAPTNGAAGIVPAVLRYALAFLPVASDESARVDARRRYLLTATAVGLLCKLRASISGAAVGCQGEIGSAASMAAAGLAELLGGTAAQIENAAEIAMEHSLGLTCDPIGGLVQIPCIERNAVGAVKAVTAATMALRGDGTHRVSLDQVLDTMRRTGMDMSDKYKETSRGGLAVSVIEC